MQVYRFRVHIIWLVAALMVLFPSISEGSDGLDGAEKVGNVQRPLMSPDFPQGVADQRAVVIPVYLGATEDGYVEKHRDRVADWLKSERIRVISPSELEALLRARQAAEPDAVIAAEFTDIEAIVAQGTEDFYYQGNDAAIEVLRPVFERGILHREVTARNPVYVEQVFQAGLMLIRAHTGAGDALAASEVAKKLAVYFPGKEPSLSLVPPDIVDIWRAEVEKLAGSGTRLVLEHAQTEGCEARIDGVPADGKGVVVKAGIDYLVSLDCGKTPAALWRVQVNSGEQVNVPLASIEQMTVSSSVSDTLLRQREIERALKAISYWADVGSVLGAFEGDSEWGVVRLEQRHQGTGEKVIWIKREARGEEHFEASFDAMMLETFPGVAMARAEKKERERLNADSKPWLSDWVTPVLFTSGAVVAAVGGVFLYDAAGQSMIMNCSPNAAKQLPSAQCKGVANVKFSDSKAYYDKWGEVDRTRVVGYTGISVGAVLVGWGAWRLISGSGTSEPTSGAVVDFWGGRESLGASARWRF